jgi:hypothetical protein
MKKMMVYLIVIIALSIFCSGFVSASAIESYVTIQPTMVPLKFNASQEPDSGVEIENVTPFLIYWNERMHWELSQIQLSDYSIKVENQILKNYSKSINGKLFHIKNLSRFDEELGSLIGLSDVQISSFIIENQKQLEIDHMNYFKETPIQSPDKPLSLSYILPGTQSAPYARGKLFYMYIFTDFMIQSSDGPWTQAEMDDAELDAGSGTLEIQDQAPSSANVVNSGAKGHVIVTGQNLGDNIASWGPNGWMENASKQFAMGQYGPYNRPTENLAYNLKYLIVQIL